MKKYFWVVSSFDKSYHYELPFLVIPLMLRGRRLTYLMVRFVKRPNGGMSKTVHLSVRSWAEPSCPPHTVHANRHTSINRSNRKLKRRKLTSNSKSMPIRFMSEHYCWKGKRISLLIRAIENTHKYDISMHNRINNNDVIIIVEPKSCSGDGHFHQMYVCIKNSRWSAAI